MNSSKELYRSRLASDFSEAQGMSVMCDRKPSEVLLQWFEN